MKFKINGLYCGSLSTDGNVQKISYEEVIVFAEKELGATVTYRKGLNGAQGEIFAGQSVTLCDGMIFNCVHTGNA